MARERTHDYGVIADILRENPDWSYKKIATEYEARTKVPLTADGCRQLVQRDPGLVKLKGVHAGGRRRLYDYEVIARIVAEDEALLRRPSAVSREYAKRAAGPHPDRNIMLHILNRAGANGLLERVAELNRSTPDDVD